MIVSPYSAPNNYLECGRLDSEVCVEILKNDVYLIFLIFRIVHMFSSK